MTEGLVCTLCGRAGRRGFHFAEDFQGPTCVNAESCAQRVAKAVRVANAGRCVDCVAEGVTTDRKLATKKGSDELQPGPRCVTHYRARKKQVSSSRHARRLASDFGITPEQYWTIYACQGGKCFGCGYATGRTKRLAVDHDHELALEHGHDPKQGCPLCVRALLCGQCNQIIGRLGVEALTRLIVVLTDPPARKWLKLET